MQRQACFSHREVFYKAFGRGLEDATELHTFGMNVFFWGRLMEAKGKRKPFVPELIAGAGLVFLLATLLVIAPRKSQAVPAFATQTGQPCSACHVGAFGPQLKQTGRDFKLYGYVNSDGQAHLPPIAASSQTDFTHAQKAIPGGAAPGFKDNNNLLEDQFSFYYAGKVTDNIGAFSQWTRNGVSHTWGWDNQDYRAIVHKDDFHGHDVLVGLDVNNNPTVSDIWNSTPAWGYPYDGSSLAPTPSEHTLIDGGLGHLVMSVGAYTMVDNLFYAELATFGNISPGGQIALGNQAVDGQDTFPGALPYWRLALQHDFGDHYFQVGTYGLNARRSPGGLTTAGTDSITDIAFDTNYQYSGSKDHFVSAHATLITEDDDLSANHVLNGTNSSDRLNTLRGDISYSYQNTWTPYFQLFKTWGSSDAALYPNSVNGSPNSAGYVAELGWVPWGKPDSPALDWFNGRLSLQYTGYTEFEGTSSHASDNNTLMLHLWMAIDPLTPLQPKNECEQSEQYCR